MVQLVVPSFPSKIVPERCTVNWKRSYKFAYAGEFVIKTCPMQTDHTQIYRVDSRKLEPSRKVKNVLVFVIEFELSRVKL